MGLSLPLRRSYTSPCSPLTVTSQHDPSSVILCPEDTIQELSPATHVPVSKTDSVLSTTKLD